MSSAPVCNIPVNIPINQPDPRLLPAIPLAHDLSSAIAAINAMRQWLMWMMNQRPHNNKTPQASLNEGNFVESNRTTQVVRIYNPNDSSQWVDVEEITGLTMTDKKSGQSWVFKG